MTPGHTEVDAAIKNKVPALSPSGLIGLSVVLLGGGAAMLRRKTTFAEPKARARNQSCKEAVLEYLDLCAVFWKPQIVRRWKDQIDAGRVPNFGANLSY